MGYWELIEKNLSDTLSIIFSGYDMSKLSLYEKRKVIFEYLSNNLCYDYDLLYKIRDFQINKNTVARNPAQELYSVISDRKGICNAISQYYKLLLEKIGVKSYCIICDDGTVVKHQLTLVYDNDNDSYSFDDVTSVIVGRGTIDDYFDYDLDYANSVNQGNREVMTGRRFLILPESYINLLVKRESSFSNNLKDLPENIVSLKKKKKINNI